MTNSGVELARVRIEHRYGNPPFIAQKTYDDLCERYFDDRDDGKPETYRVECRNEKTGETLWVRDMTSREYDDWLHYQLEWVVPH